MISLIDADVVAFRCAASCEPSKNKPFQEPKEDAIRRADELMLRIVAETSDEYLAWISGEGNFRKVIDPTYKANRTRPKPTWLNDVREFLVRQWNVQICEEYEADDAIGIAAQGDHIVCSNDKDLLQISGSHYNIVSGATIWMDEAQAEKVPYHLMMEGDISDNIVGVAGIGKKKAALICNKYDNIKELHDYVRFLYNDDDRFIRNLRLIRVLRSEEEWNEVQEQIRGGVREPDETPV